VFTVCECELVRLQLEAADLGQATSSDRHCPQVLLSNEFGYKRERHLFNSLELGNVDTVNTRN